MLSGAILADSEIYQKLILQPRVRITQKNLEDLQNLERLNPKENLIKVHDSTNLANLVNLANLANLVLRSQKQEYKKLLREKIQLVPRIYPRRTEFQGFSKSTDSFEEAIEKGLRFTSEQYKEEISEFLNYGTATAEEIQFLVNLFQEYPEIYSVMKNYQFGNTLLEALLKIYYLEDPSPVQLLYAYAVNFPVSFSEPEEKKLRRARLRNLPRDYIQTIYGIYQSEELEKILDTPQHPLENYVYLLQELPIEELSPEDLTNLTAGFGMIIPEQVSPIEVREYILHWLPYYRDLMTRKNPVPKFSELPLTRLNNLEEAIEVFKIYSDQEIVSYFGQAGSFRNRNSLIENLFRSLTKGGFIVFSTLDLDRAINTQTTLSTGVSELPKPYLVYGSPIQFRVLELDELIKEWTDRNDFPRIGEEGTYTLPQIAKLYYLLSLIGKTNKELRTKVKYLLNQIKKNLLINMKTSPDLIELTRTLTQTTEQGRLLLRKIFQGIFYTGLYLLDWQGPGNRYPNPYSYLSSEEKFRVGDKTTSVIRLDPRVILILSKVDKELSELEEAYPLSLAAFQQLPVVEFNPPVGIFMFLQDKLSDLIKELAKLAQGTSVGQESLVQIGAKLVSSTYYYLAVLFNELDPKFNLSPLGSF